MGQIYCSRSVCLQRSYSREYRSPFELLYGRTVRGPLQILKELWTKEIESDETKTTYEYVLDLRNRLEETLKVAQVELAKTREGTRPMQTRVEGTRVYR